MAIAPPGDWKNRRGVCKVCGEEKGLVPDPPGGRICPRCWQQEEDE